ncbi:hypothetical protein WN66_03490 [Saccharomyces cerevisiae]|nr:hypothetical protein WN66_03490 [Saccharomyces cerevisiae]
MLDYFFLLAFCDVYYTETFWYHFFLKSFINDANPPLGFFFLPKAALADFALIKLFPSSDESPESSESDSDLESELESDTESELELESESELDSSSLLEGAFVCDFSFDLEVFSFTSGMPLETRSDNELKEGRTFLGRS